MYHLTNKCTRLESMHNLFFCPPAGAKKLSWSYDIVMLMSSSLFCMFVFVIQGLDVDSLVIEHIQVNAAPKMRRRTYRAHGRINRKFMHLWDFFWGGGGDYPLCDTHWCWVHSENLCALFYIYSHMLVKINKWISKKVSVMHTGWCAFVLWIPFF